MYIIEINIITHVQIYCVCTIILLLDLLITISIKTYLNRFRHAWFTSLCRIIPTMQMCIERCIFYYNKHMYIRTVLLENTFIYNVCMGVYRLYIYNIYYIYICIYIYIYIYI